MSFLLRWTCCSPTTRVSTPSIWSKLGSGPGHPELSFPCSSLPPAPPTLDDVEADPGINWSLWGTWCLSWSGRKPRGGVRPRAGVGGAYQAVHSVLHLLGYDHLDERADEGARCGMQ